MKLQYYLAATAVLLATAACSSDDEAMSSGFSDDIVRIQPSIGAQIATRTLPADPDSATSTKFIDGDTIMVSKDSVNFYAYVFDGNEWTPVRSNHSDAYLKWGSPTDREIKLYAYYPASASLTKFEVPSFQDQKALTNPNNIKNADYMTFIGTATRGDNNAVKLAMKRHMARVRVTIDKLGNELDEYGSDIRFTPSIYSPYQKVSLTYGENGVSMSGDGEKPYKVQPNNCNLIKKGATATALVVPLAAVSSSQKFIQVTVFDSLFNRIDGDFIVRGIPTHAPGYSYDYHLTVGKDSIAISSVTVSPWTGEVVNTDSEAEETSYVIGENGTYHVYNAAGLNVWSKAVKADPSLSLILEDDIDLKGAD